MQVPIPAVPHGDERPVTQADLPQGVTDQRRPLEVQDLGAPCRLSGRVAETERLDGDDVEEGCRAGRDHPLQEIRLVDGGVAAVDGRRQGSRPDQGVRIRRPNGGAGGAQQVGIGHRLYVAVAPVRGDVRFVPHLVVAHAVAVASGNRGGEVGEGVRFGGGGQRIVGLGAIRRARAQAGLPSNTRTGISPAAAMAATSASGVGQS